MALFLSHNLDFLSIFVILALAENKDNNREL